MPGKPRRLVAAQVVTSVLFCELVRVNFLIHQFTFIGRGSVCQRLSSFLSGDWESGKGCHARDP